MLVLPCRCQLRPSADDNIFYQNLQVFSNFLRRLVLSCLVIREVTRMCHVHYKQSRFVSLVVKGKFGLTSKSRKIL